MNLVVLIGRLTRDPELRVVANNTRSVANFTLAVNRQFSKEKEADFFRIVVWGKQAEHVDNYLKKESQCAVTGSIQNSSYQDKDGTTRYSTDIIADRVEFLSYSGGSSAEVSESAAPDESDFPMVDDDVPF